MCLSLNERSCHCGLAHHSHGVLVHTARRLGELQGRETMFEVLHFLARLGEQSSSCQWHLGHYVRRLCKQAEHAMHVAVTHVTATHCQIRRQVVIGFWNAPCSCKIDYVDFILKGRK